MGNAVASDGALAMQCQSCHGRMSEVGAHGRVSLAQQLAGHVMMGERLRIAAQYRLPKIVLLRMGLNIAENAMIGIIPIFGDIFSIWFRSNVKNAQLLERYISAQGQESTARDWIFVSAVIVGILLLLIGIVIATAWLLRQLWNAV